MMLLSAGESSGTESGGGSAMSVGIKSASLGVSVLSVEPLVTRSPRKLRSLKRGRRHRHRHRSKGKNDKSPGLSSSQSSDDSMTYFGAGLLNNSYQRNLHDSASEPDFADSESAGWDQQPKDVPRRPSFDDKFRGGRRRLPSLGTSVSKASHHSATDLHGSDSDDVSLNSSIPPATHSSVHTSKRRHTVSSASSVPGGTTVNGKLDGESSLLSESTFLSLNSFPVDSDQNQLHLIESAE